MADCGLHAWEWIPAKTGTWPFDMYGWVAHTEVTQNPDSANDAGGGRHCQRWQQDCIQPNTQVRTQE